VGRAGCDLGDGGSEHVTILLRRRPADIGEAP
jgi:hypothetical protein